MNNIKLSFNYGKIVKWLALPHLYNQLSRSLPNPLGAPVVLILFLTIVSIILNSDPKQSHASIDIPTHTHQLEPFIIEKLDKSCSDKVETSSGLFRDHILIKNNSCCLTGQLSRKRTTNRLLCLYCRCWSPAGNYCRPFRSSGANFHSGHRMKESMTTGQKSESS